MIKYFFILIAFIFPVANANVLADVQQFFQHAKFKDMKISPDGEHVAFNYEYDTEVRLAVMNLQKMQIISSFGFGDNMHVINFHWPNNHRVLMEVGEITGNLVDINGVRIDLYAANIDGTRRNLLFKTEASTYRILHLLPEQPDRILIGKQHWAEKNGLRAFTLDINRGRERYLNDQPNGIVGALIADNSGAIRIGIEVIEGKTFDDNRTVIHYKKNNTWQQLMLPSTRKNPNIYPLGFSSDNSKLYFSSNHDIEDNDVSGLFVYDFNSSDITLLSRHKYSDIGRAFYSHEGDVLAISYVAAINEYQFINTEHDDALLLAGLKSAFPGQMVNITSFNRKGDIAVFKVESDRNPGEFYLFDRAKGQARYLASAFENLPAESLVSMNPVEFVARDGKVIRGFLTMPKNVEQNAALIVNVHGGPYGVHDKWGFNPEVQFLASRGYAVLQINFRGSGGYGDDFQRAGRLEWGKAMQDDITDGTHWAIKQGIADPERICIYGGSYGGYAALWGVIKEPELYKCSVGYVGVYDMPTFFNGDGSDVSRHNSISQYLEAHVGSGTDYLRSISPAHNVDKIKAELFLVHGSKDVRVPIIHANNLRKALDSVGKSYEWMVKDDGHGFYKLENRVALYRAMAEFFDKHIGKSALSAEETKTQ